MKKQKDKPLNTPLAKAFNFTHGDLESNRAGFMSHRQRKEIWKNWRGINLLAGIYFGLGGLFISVSCMVPFVLDFLQTGNYFPYKDIDSPFLIFLISLWLCISFFLCLIGILALFLTLRSFRKLKHGLKDNKVKIIRGVVVKRIPMPKRTYLIGIHNTEERASWSEYVSQEQFNAFEENGFYAIYFKPTLKRILSAEPTSPEEIE